MGDINSSKGNRAGGNSAEFILGGAKRIAYTVGGVATFSIACLSYPLYHYDVLGYQEKLKLRVKTLLSTTEGKALLATDGVIERPSDDFIDRVKGARTEVMVRFESLDIGIEVPDIEKKRIFIGNISSSGGLKSITGLKSGLGEDYMLLFKKGEDIGDSTIRHEVAHISQNINYPSWIREFGADAIAGTDRIESSHAYWINFVWAKVLFGPDSDQVIKDMYNPDKTSEDVMIEVDEYVDMFIKVQKDNYPHESEYLSRREGYISIFLHGSNPRALSNITNYLMNERPELWGKILDIDIKDIEANMLKFVGKEDTQFDLRFELLKYTLYLFMNAYLTILLRESKFRE